MREEGQQIVNDRITSTAARHLQFDSRLTASNKDVKKDDFSSDRWLTFFASISFVQRLSEASVRLFCCIAYRAVAAPILARCWDALCLFRVQWLGNRAQFHCSSTGFMSLVFAHIEVSPHHPCFITTSWIIKLLARCHSPFQVHSHITMRHASGKRIDSCLMKCSILHVST